MVRIRTHRRLLTCPKCGNTGQMMTEETNPDHHESRKQLAGLTGFRDERTASGGLDLICEKCGHRMPAPN